MTGVERRVGELEASIRCRTYWQEETYNKYSNTNKQDRQIAFNKKIKQIISIKIKQKHTTQQTEQKTVDKKMMFRKKKRETNI